MSAMHNAASFNQIFEEAAADFNEITNKGDKGVKGIGGLTLEDVLDRFGRLSAGEDAEAQAQKDQTKAVVMNVLKGLQILNGFAAQAASAMFPYSNVCFNAVGWLLKIPETISQLHAAIGELFYTIESYLVRFGILKRAEEQGGGMAPEMINSTKPIMKCFVRICAYCYTAWTGGRWGKVKLAFKAVFANEGTKVKQELNEFEKLTRQQEAITGAATLEAVLRSNRELSDVSVIVRNMDWALMTVSNKVDNVAEGVGVMSNKFDRVGEDVEVVSGKVDRVGEGVGALVKEAADRGLKEELNKNLDEIAKLFGLKNEYGQADSVEQEKIREEVAQKAVKGSGQWLNSLPAYQEWWNQTSTKHMLVLRGGPGCGKHFLASRIGEDLDKRSTGEVRYSVGYYHFTKYQADSNDKDSRLDSVASALKIMALQIARKNLPYRRELLNSCRSADEDLLKGEKPVIKDLWNVLKFASASSKSSYTFVLIFDGYEQLEYTKAEDLVKILNLTTQEIANAIDKTRFRVLIAGTDEVAPNAKMRLLQDAPDIVVDEHNRPDIVSFIEEQLKNPLFASLNSRVEEGDDSDLTQAVREDFPNIVRGNFSDVLAKIERLEAILKETDDEETIPQVKKVLREDSDIIRFKNATTAIADLNKALTPKDIRQLNAALQWLAYGGYGCTMHVLEAVIFHKGLYSRSQLESFPQKVRNPAKFGRILNVEKRYDEDYVELDRQVLEHLENQNLRNFESKSEQDTNTASVTMTITFNRTTHEDVKNFLWMLRENTASEIGPFPPPEKLVNKEKIYIDPAESYSSMVEQALDVLTDEPDVKTEALVEWVIFWLSDNLDIKKLNSDQDSTAIVFRNKPKILRRLVSMLTGTTLTIKHWALRYWSVRWRWLDSDDTIEAITSWLQDEEAVDQLKPKHKRRLEKLLEQSEGKGGFWKPLTIEIAKDWLLQDDGVFFDSYDWIDGYISMQKRPNATQSRSETPQATQETQEDDPKPSLRRAQTTLSEDIKPSLQRSMTDIVVKAEAEAETPKTSEIPVDAEESVINDNQDAVKTGSTEPESLQENLSTVESINRAANWARKQLSLSKLNSTWFYRLAKTFDYQNETQEAVRLLKEGTQSFPREWKLHNELAKIYERKESKQAALRHAYAAVEILEAGDEPDEELKKSIDSYSRLASLQANAKLMDAASKTFTTIFKLVPNNYVLRCKYLKALEYNGRQDEVAEFFASTHNQKSKEENLTELSYIFFKLSDSDEVQYLLDMYTTMIRCKQLSLALESIRSAISHMREQKNINRKHITNLEAIEANATAMSPHDDDGIHQAFEKWTNVSASYRQLDDLYWKESLLHWRSDQLRGSYCLYQIEQNGSPKHVMYLKEISELHKDWGVQNTMTYLARYNLKQGLKNEAKELFATQMRDAFEVLSNEDISDDWVGYSSMAEIFERLDEDENAWTAWSLIGPENQKAEPADRDNDGQADDADLPDDAVPPTPSDRPLRAGRWGQVCDGHCDKEWTFADDFVRCKICPQTTFCRECYDRLRQGSPAFYWCHPNHQFLEVPAWPVQDWPLGRKKVCIGGWARPDGEVVDIDVWLDRIRKDWNLEKPNQYDWQKTSEEES